MASPIFPGSGPVTKSIRADRASRRILLRHDIAPDDRRDRPGKRAFSPAYEVRYITVFLLVVTNLENDHGATHRTGIRQSVGCAGCGTSGLTLAVRAQGPAPDTGNLRVEKDIVFGKAGTTELKLDVYQPPVGVTPKRLAIIHLFGGGFMGGNKSAGYIINDVKALGARGYTNISANYRLAERGVLAGAGWWREGSDPLDARERREAGHRAQQDRCRWVLSRRHALAAGRRHKRKAGVRRRPRHARRQLRGERLDRCLSAGERARSPRCSFRRGRRRPNIAAASPTSYISKTFAPTIFIHGTNDTTVPVKMTLTFWTKLQALGVPSTMTLIQGAAACLR